MELINPGLGLIFWMTLAFSIVLFVLRKYAWRPIMGTIKERENFIASAIAEGKRIKKEFANLDATKEKMLKEAKVSADELLNNAKHEAQQVLELARQNARDEALKILEENVRRIEAERRAVEEDVRAQIANLSVDLASKVLQEEFTDLAKNQKFVGKLLDNIQLN